MTRFERFVTLSNTTCCICDRSLSVQELDEFRSATDEHMHGVVYCRTCMEHHLMLCRECSGRYTAGGICEECAIKEYSLAS